MTRSNRHPTVADALIDEVRQRRRDLLAACENDLTKLAELIRRRESEHPARVADPRNERSPNA